ncbi:MAG: hypothetical protein JNK30_10845 [Phenylobacterium sp.]|uniref:hypothetical protein n=1 Tax=Phenylobacterium sp. TaxID=1871053 RepID=UPI001A6110D6|nr:hypothetical protein [Phenylobacterium sp.]MBL8771868.1 hypothetical protein [Phenylobacterium sp.]
MMLTVLALSAALLQEQAVREAIEDEIDFGVHATIDKDIDRYMETVPADYRIVEDDGSITDRAALRARQLQAWSIITRTHALRIDVTRVEVGCDGHCATAWTDQRWDRQMLGRDGRTEFNVVTTQKHVERWEARDSRWIQVSIEELGGETLVDGKPY